MLGRSTQLETYSSQFSHHALGSSLINGTQTLCVICHVLLNGEVAAHKVAVGQHWVRSRWLKG